MRYSPFQIVIPYAGHFPFLCLLCALWVSGNLSVQAQQVSPTIEYQVKASLVFNFMHFVEWPEEILRNNSNQIAVCMIGPNVYGRALRALEGEVAQGKRLTIRLHTEGWSPALADTCHVAIFTEQTPDAMRTALPVLANKSVLTIGETATFLEDGGMIRFRIINETVQFEINYTMAKRARLIVSSKLLRLASSVMNN